MYLQELLVLVKLKLIQIVRTRIKIKTIAAFTRPGLRHCKIPNFLFQFQSII